MSKADTPAVLASRLNPRPSIIPPWSQMFLPAVTPPTPLENLPRHPRPDREFFPKPLAMRRDSIPRPKIIG
jgi:hypothetical protein